MQMAMRVCSIIKHLVLYTDDKLIILVSLAACKCYLPLFIACNASLHVSAPSGTEHQHGGYSHLTPMQCNYRLPNPSLPLDASNRKHKKQLLNRLQVYAGMGDHVKWHPDGISNRQ